MFTFLCIEEHSPSSCPVSSVIQILRQHWSRLRVAYCLLYTDVTSANMEQSLEIEQGRSAGFFLSVRKQLSIILNLSSFQSHKLCVLEPLLIYIGFSGWLISCYTGRYPASARNIFGRNRTKVFLKGPQLFGRCEAPSDCLARQVPFPFLRPSTRQWQFLFNCNQREGIL